MTAEEQASSEDGKESRRISKERHGVVISAKNAKTVVVAVERRVRHRKYKKYLTVRKRYAAHDILGCALGDQVRIRESRPISKNKRWRVVEKISGGRTQ